MLLSHFEILQDIFPVVFNYADEYWNISLIVFRNNYTNVSREKQRLIKQTDICVSLAFTRRQWYTRRVAKEALDRILLLCLMISSYPSEISYEILCTRIVYECNIRVILFISLRLMERKSNWKYAYIRTWMNFNVPSNLDFLTANDLNQNWREKNMKFETLVPLLLLCTYVNV